MKYMVLRQLLDFGRNVRDAADNLATGNPSPLERSIRVPAIADQGVFNYAKLDESQGIGGTMVYDAINFTNKGLVDVDVVYATGRHTIFAGQAFDLELPKGTTRVWLHASAGAISDGKIQSIVKMRRVDPNGRR